MAEKWRGLDERPGVDRVLAERVFLAPLGLHDEHVLGVVMPAKAKLVGGRAIEMDVDRRQEVTAKAVGQLGQAWIVPLGVTNYQRVPLGMQPADFVIIRHARPLQIQ